MAASADQIAGYSAARSRTISAALELFSEKGVSGTSLQMIADAVGVTKAAIYHQFPTKEAIVLAVADVEMAGIEQALDVTGAEDGSVEGRAALLDFVIDLAVRRRSALSMLQSDPVMIRLLAQHEPFNIVQERMFAVLLGDRSGVRSRVQAAVLSAAIGGSLVHPLVADVDAETLKEELLHVMRRLVALPD
ncbi:MAG: TetR/AcrR family transcriptional regulator [Mycobacteriales bacterium]